MEIINKYKMKMESIIYAVVMTIIAGVFTNMGLALMLPYVESSYRYIGFLLFALCLISGFIIIPKLITDKIFSPNLLKFNLNMINKNRTVILFIFITLIGTYVGGIDKTIFFLLIALCEEYLFRHTIFKVLSEDNSIFWSAIIGSLIFAVILHSNYGIIDNLLVRMPFSLIFYYVAIKYKLQDAVAFHWIYNILVTTL